MLEIIDHTISPMGGRLLKRWVTFPLKDKQSIDERLDIIENFIANKHDSDELRHNIQTDRRPGTSYIKSCNRSNISEEVIQVRRALGAIEPIKKICSESANSDLKRIR